MSIESAAGKRISPRLIMATFGVLFGVLALGYFLFLRADYAPIFTQLRPADASVIVAQLESKDIPYELGDNGTTILVPGDQANKARMLIAGADAALKGGVGFELFNKSDMGLTDFAQRINYQRALQGELERSIMMLEDIETARVHLAMPERTIFRAERTSAKAAVELIPKAGKRLDEARIAGIQRLVAFAVPDLMQSDVVVLDGDGRLLSASGMDNGLLSPDVEERQSLQNYFSARAKAAFQQALPGARAEISIVASNEGNGEPSVRASSPPAMLADNSVSPSGGERPDGAPARDFRLEVLVATGAPLNPEDMALARSAISSALALDENNGDRLTFRVGPGAAAPASQQAYSHASSRAPAATETLHPLPSLDWLYWLIAGIAVAIGVVLLIVRFVPRPSGLNAVEREAMVERIRAALRESDGPHVAA